MSAYAGLRPALDPPRTLHEATAGTYHQGAVVNLEVDVVARYVERMPRTGGV